MQDQQFDEQLDIPDLFHKSSLRQTGDPQLPIIGQEVYIVKKWKDEQNYPRINHYKILEEIGQGSFGQVFKVYLENDKYFAMKIYSKISLKGQKFFAADGQFANGLDMLQNELNIIKRLDNINICRCYEILYGTDKTYSINQLCDLGPIMKWNELNSCYLRNTKILEYIIKKYKLQYLNQLKNQQLSQIIRIIFIQVCKGILYLHKNYITNRDIKVDNILCSSNCQIGSEIKIIDFTTVRYSKDDISYFPSGTPGFRAPQHQFASSQGYSSRASDIWSIGICLYTFFHEKLPFYAESQLQIDIQAKNNQLKLSQDCPKWMIEFLNLSTCKLWQERANIEKMIQIITNI